jgi:TIR domain
MKKEYEFDVSLSFAGEDRGFVELVAEILKAKNIKVFYDKYEQTNLWGKDLYTHLDDVYRNKSRYCVIFISENYKNKLWTNHERVSAQARAFQDNEEYILPYRLDKTEILGIRPTVGYLSDMDAKSLSLAIADKICKNTEEVEVNLSDETKVSNETEKFSLVEYGVLVDNRGNAEIRINDFEFFNNRLASAFPGGRGLQWFIDPKVIIKRFEILFRKPLTFNKFPNQSEYGGEISPFWWFRRGSSNSIDNYEKLSDTKCLIEWNEYEVDKIAVYRDSSSYKNFIYVETKAEPPIYDIDPDLDKYIKLRLEDETYVSQEYGLYEDKPIKREEYDDGAAIIDDEVIDIRGKSSFRIRFLTRYNFIICAQSAIYNSNESDDLFGEFMDKVLTGENPKLEDYLPKLLKIPREKHFRNMD